MKEYKPKSIMTLRKMVIDMRNHCANVSNSKFFGCHTCPYHVISSNDVILCYFENIGGKRPAEWVETEMGRYL